MKTRLLSFVLLVSSPLALAAGLQTASFDVENMTCPTCAITIEKALERIDGVAAVQVDADAETVTVEFDPALSTPAAIQEAISQAGFPARPENSDA